MLAAYGAGSMLVALVLPRALKRLPDLSVMRSGAVLLPVGLVLAAAAIHMPPGPVHWAALGLVWFLLGAATSLIATPSSRLLRRSADTKDQPAVFAAQFSLSHACYLVAKRPRPPAGWGRGCACPPSRFFWPPQPPRRPRPLGRWPAPGHPRNCFLAMLIFRK